MGSDGKPCDELRLVESPNHLQVPVTAKEVLQEAVRAELRF